MQALAKLFGSPARLKIIRLFVFNQGASLSLPEIAARTKLGADAARYELTGLLAANLIRKKGANTSALYQTNPHFEHLGALADFIRDTTMVDSRRVVALLRKVGTLRLVVLSGLFMDISESQIDLLIVGDRLVERTVAAAIRSLEAELGREVRYATFSTEDFRYRVGVYDRLLRDVFDYPHRLLVDKIGL